MSHEICKSISRIRQNAEGKWYATLTSAVNNLRPLSYRKVDFVPQESKRKMIAIILHDIYNGNIHMTGKSPYGAFLDECYYGIIKSPAWDKILRYERYHNMAWTVSSKHNHWHGQEIKPRMDAKYNRICQKARELTEVAEMEWAKEYEGWTPCKDRFTVRIDGARIVSWRESSRNGSAHWEYCQPWDTTTKSKEFTAVEKAKIERRLAGRREVTSEKVTEGNAKAA